MEALTREEEANKGAELKQLQEDYAQRIDEKEKNITHNE